ncbi:alpha/beta fold hydrolase [Variovorax sp.]|uniref:alpha/beta fold hydrolase n=1 Tax=Variovorax sp. TaxID=1871043 RepID=UPI002D50D89D|nr:alpha/beta fold hydrolase [Variovorax sp.]HYP82729.1 alpha/beta fold hydrolase [Variovorax sp.]
MADTSNMRHAVLVHGAWQGSWAFDAWTPLLAAQGWQAHAVDLPGNGWPPLGQAPANLDSYVAEVARVVLSIDAPVILVGHSGGGITVSQVAEELHRRIAGVVYLAGMMLPSGMSYVDVLNDLSASDPGADFAGIGSWLDWNEDRSASTVRIEGALQCFVQDCEPAAARKAASLLRPQPETGRAMRNRLSAERFGTVPRIYVECRDDQSVSLPVQQRMQALSPGAKRIPMPCGHVPQLAQPQRLTELLLPEFDALLARHASLSSLPLHD